MTWLAPLDEFYFKPAAAASFVLGGLPQGPPGRSPPSQALREGLQPPPLPVPMRLPLPFLRSLEHRFQGTCCGPGAAQPLLWGHPRGFCPRWANNHPSLCSFQLGDSTETSSHHRVSSARTEPRFSLESQHAWVLKGGGRLRASRARDGGGALAGGRPISQLSAPWEGGLRCSRRG